MAPTPANEVATPVSRRSARARETPRSAAARK